MSIPGGWGWDNPPHHSPAEVRAEVKLEGAEERAVIKVLPYLFALLALAWLAVWLTRL